MAALRCARTLAGVLDADGRMVAPASTLEPPSTFWNQLTVIPTEHAGAISVFAENDDHSELIWLLRELDSSSEIVFSSQVTLPKDYTCTNNGADGCAIVEDADGYYIAFNTNAGMTRIARLRRAAL